MTKLVNRAKMTTATTGTGTITLGSAVDGYQTFAAAGVANADVVRYVIEDGDAWEIGLGTYSSGTLTRGSIESSNADAALNLTGNAVVFVSAAAADIAVGPNFTALASGTLSNGSVVVLNSDGTVSEVSETVSPAGYGSNSTQNATNFLQHSFYDPAFGKYGVVYYDTGAAQYVLSFATVVDKALSFETPIGLSVAPTTSGQVRFCYDVASQKLICFYQDIVYTPSYSNTGIKAFVGDVTASSVTFGSVVTVYGSAVNLNLDLVYDSVAEKIVAFFADSNSYGNAIVCDFSTATPSFGTPTVYRSAIIGSSTTGRHDPYSGRILYIYARGTTFEAVSGLVSGTSISFGGYQGNFIAARMVSNDKVSVGLGTGGRFVLAFRNQNDGFKTYLYSGSVSSSDGYITWLNSYTVETTYSNAFDVNYVEAGDKFIFSYQKNTSPTVYGSRLVTNASGVLTIGSQTVKINPGTAGVNQTTSAFNSAKTEIVVFALDSSSVVNAYVYAGETTVSNYDGFIGFSSGSYGDGQTATVLVNGAVTDAQSGLTINSSYYVQQDGSLSATPDQIELYAGRAIASTKLLIKG